MPSRFEDFPEDRRSWTRLEYAGAGLVRVALLFGSAVIALALILVPLLEKRTRDVVINRTGLDRIITGSIDGGRSGHVFTVRRSILNPGPETVCIIRENGTRSGAC